MTYIPFTEEQLDQARNKIKKKGHGSKSYAKPA